MKIMHLCDTKSINLTEINKSPEFYLQKHFGYKTFRYPQKEIIENVLAGNDSVVLMPTGGGKSMCFQLPACMMNGLTIVISPLISLMKDQVEALKTNGIEAEFLNSSLSAEAEMQINQKLSQNKIKLLYISPERLFSSKLIDQLHLYNVSLIAIDEAHCISGWGHDFRPEYSQLNVLKQNYPNIPVIALTATADRAVREDIVEVLGLKNASTFISSFDRPNLSLTVLPAQQRLKKIIEIISKYPDQSGIIYCSSRKQTETVATKLNEAGFDTACYHAGLDQLVRNKVQEDFINGQVKIICATLAFGMGIDKSDVRFVLHYNLPKNLEGYYQEIGRAGRDGLPAETVLFYGYGDVATQMYFIDQISDLHYRKIQEDKLRRIQEYAEAQICRRKVLLAYFSEHAPNDCGNCDVCQNPPKYAVGTTEAKMALSAIARTNEDAGMTTIIDILRGNAVAGVIEHGFDKIKTFGVGRNISASNWAMYLQQFIQQGIIEIDYRHRNKLKLNAASVKVLTGQLEVQLVSFETIKKRNEALKQKSKEKVLFTDPDDELFEKLRILRKTLAEKAGKPPFTVFSDVTLKQMAEAKPTNILSLLDVSGVGEHKAKIYGEVFLNEIAAFQLKRNKKPSKPGDTHQVTLALYRQNKPVSEIAKERQLSEGTIYSHLLDIFTNEHEAIDVFSFVSPSEMEKIREARITLQQTVQLKPYYEFFNGEIDYNKLRFALVYLDREKQETITI